MGSYPPPPLPSKKILFDQSPIKFYIFARLAENALENIYSVKLS